MPIASNYLGRACANSAPCPCPTQPSLDPPLAQRQSSIRPKGSLPRPASDRNSVRHQIGMPVRLRVGITVRHHRNTHTERGYPVAEVSQRLGVSQHSLYEWKQKFAASNAKGNDEAEEIRRLKKELARVTEERDIL